MLRCSAMIGYVLVLHKDWCYFTVSLQDDLGSFFFTPIQFADFESNHFKMYIVALNALLILFHRIRPVFI